MMVIFCSQQCCMSRIVITQRICDNTLFTLLVVYTVRNKYLVVATITIVYRLITPTEAKCNYRQLGIIF